MVYTEHLAAIGKLSRPLDCNAWTEPDLENAVVRLNVSQRQRSHIALEVRRTSCHNQTGDSAE
jgi:hypothetical protein